jgi:hypothetical protein
MKGEGMARMAMSSTGLQGRAREGSVRRRAVRAVAMAVTALFVVLWTPTPAAAAQKPWWQVLTGSRPTNLWKPTDNVQEIGTGTVDLFGVPTVAARIAVGGVPVGCLGAGLGTVFCGTETGFPPTETAAQLEELLEQVYGTITVEVTGGPVGGKPFKVVVPQKSVPPIEVEVLIFKIGEEEIALGTASSKVLSPGGSGRLIITATNLGDAPVDGSESPVTIVDELPTGIEAVKAEGFAGVLGTAGPVDCKVDDPSHVTCTYEGSLPSYEAIEVEILVNVDVEAPGVGSPGHVSVQGGKALPVESSQPVRISEDPTPFGIEHFSAIAEDEGGETASQAGEHPFQFTTTLQFNAGPMDRNGGVATHSGQPPMPRNFRLDQPVGFTGNASAQPTCLLADFYARSLENTCPDSTAIGVASVTILEPESQSLMRLAVPVFNLPPAYGEPARFGFTAVGTPIVIDTAVDPNNEYRVVDSIRNTTQLSVPLSATVSIWGAPSDPRHDNARGWACVYKLKNLGTCSRPAGLSETAFLRQPVDCVTPFSFLAELEPWNVPIGSVVKKEEYAGSPQVGCNQVPFEPGVSASPTSKLAGNPTGLDFAIDMKNLGLAAQDAIAEGQAKKVEVTLPEGMTLNPSQGEGLVGCSPEGLARETASSLPGEGCPEASKIGQIQATTPLLKEEGRGSLYVATPHDNPFGSLLALYMVVKVPERGVIVKQAGKVEPDPVTGQLTTTFDDLPELPFSTFKLHFKEGGRAPLVTPPACGTYEIVARFTPWSAADPENPSPEEIVTKETPFTIERGVDGGACPGGGLPPFHPDLRAGTVNNAAGSYSPFNLRLTRNDGEQEFTHFSIKLPPGVIGKLAGIPACGDAQIAAARARTGPNGGLEELEHPSCPQASQVGRTLVGAGVGASLTYVPGKIYLAGRYRGAPLSIVSVTAARVGPFDLGTVVVRQAVRINPETAEVFIDAANSDPIPHIIQGIPVHARDIRAYVDRPEFMLNPTNCERTSTASTVVGSGLDFGSASDDQPVTVTSPFQAADCLNLGFKPRMSFVLKGGTRRGATPALRAVVMPRKGDANFARAQVTLPHSVFLEQAHIRTVCTRVQFNAGGGNGEQCPKASIYGRARAVTPLLDEPFTGPVFLRSSSHPLPDIVMALHSERADFDLVGRLDSGKGGTLRTTFEEVPDVPATKLVLEMQGGKKSLFVNSRNICLGKNRAIAALEAQNGLQRTLHPIVHAKGCGGGKKKSKR